MIDTARGESWPENLKIAAVLDEVGELLESHGANPFRVRAYRVAADTVREHGCPLSEILQRDGRPGLLQLPGIGKSLAQAIEQLILTERLPLLERLRGEDSGERLLATVPNIGPGLARRIHETLGIETLPELAAAARDGRLAEVPGMGRKRIRAVRESLAGRFARRPPGATPSSRPPAGADSAAGTDRDVPVSELLEIDDQYRQLARLGKLPRIAPRRFNPTQAAWLPVLHTEREDRHYTVLYSNSARAHEMGATHDWVVILRDDHGGAGRWTVITANYGPLRGRRVVRGREHECWTVDQPGATAPPAASPGDREPSGEW